MNESSAGFRTAVAPTGGLRPDTVPSGFPAPRRAGVPGGSLEARMSAGLAAITSVVSSPAEEDGDKVASLLCVMTAIVPGARWATLTEQQIGRSRLRTVAASDAPGSLADEVQFRTRQGPTVHAVVRRSPALVHDVTSETRWPEFSRLVLAQTPIRSALSFPLHGHHDTATAVTLYGVAPHAFAGDAVYLASVTMGAVETALAGLAQRARARNLHQALMTNRRIGVAVGILMTRHQWTEEHAFTELATFSQSQNRKVLDLAEEVTATGDLPDRRQ